MISDISKLLQLKSYCMECIDRYDKVKMFDVSKRFRYISDELEEMIRSTGWEPIPEECIPDD